MNEWNVYKVFGNGKRAKNPYTSFNAEEANHFFDKILPTLGAKLQKSKWVVIDSEAPQARPAENVDNAEQLRIKKIQMVLKTVASRKHPNLIGERFAGALMMNEHTNWKWAWCIVQPATHNFIAMVSEPFEQRQEALEWIPTEYQKMVG